VDLCLSLFPWATFRSTKSAIKIHTLLDLKGSIPVFVNLTPGSVHDVKILDVLPIEKESIVAMDRGYTDFRRLYAIHQTPAFFVIRAKRNLKYVRIFSRPVDKTTGLRDDQMVILKTPASRTAFPESLRRVTFNDPDTGDRLVFLTNIFSVPAKTVADIYKHRWQIELFFRWIKQHLKIKRFYGTSPNAVKIQIWTAIAVYLLVAIMKKRLRLPGNLHTILQILETNIFERRSFFQVVNDAFKYKTEPQSSNQLNLFDS